MEGKIVIMSALLVGLIVVLGQIQVEAKTCCKTADAKNKYNVCRIGAFISTAVCAATAGCKVVDKAKGCPPGWTYNMLENTSVNEYCKSGCVSSVCGAITTLKNSDASEVVNRAVEKCSNACSDFCTKGSFAAVETA